MDEVFAETKSVSTPVNAFYVFRYLSDILTPHNKAADADDSPAFWTPEPYYWLPGIQTLSARSSRSKGTNNSWISVVTRTGPVNEDYISPVSNNRFFFAAKGGHNAESHNHNDVGNFVLYCEGQPVIIDAGSQTYTKDTFSDKRYTLWHTQSQYHNVPLIGSEGHAFGQASGKEYCAKDVSCETTSDGGVCFAMDIAAAYPAAAALKSCRRRFTFFPAGRLLLEDEWKFAHGQAQPVALHFMLYDVPAQSGDRIVLSNRVMMDVDLSAWKPAVDTIELTDPKIRRDWGRDTIYRLRLEARNDAPPAEGRCRILFREV
jgi:hypothetical protein